MLRLTLALGCATLLSGYIWYKRRDPGTYDRLGYTSIGIPT